MELELIGIVQNLVKPEMDGCQKLVHSEQRFSSQLSLIGVISGSD